MVAIKKEYHLDVTDILIWAGIFIITIWALGKATGLINSPVWVDMIPVFGVVVTIAGISLKIGAILQKLNQVIFDVGNMWMEVKDIDKRVIAIETKAY